MRRALVTGGTQGIGAAIVRALARDGVRVATTARGPLPAGETPDLFVQADVSTVEGVDEVVERVTAAFGGVDILVHNVGGSSAPAGGFSVLRDQDWQRAIDANLFAAVRLDRAFIPGMLERRSGTVVHITEYKGRLFMTTDEFTGTQIWSVPTGATTLPQTAVLEGTLAGEYYCDGVAADDFYYYLACSNGDRLIRVDRVTLAPELISNAIDINSTKDAVTRTTSTPMGAPMSCTCRPTMGK